MKDKTILQAISYISTNKNISYECKNNNQKHGNFERKKNTKIKGEF